MPAIPYLNLDLSLERSGEGYRARVLTSPAGEATSIVEAPFPPAGLAVVAAGFPPPLTGAGRHALPDPIGAAEVSESPAPPVGLRTIGSHLFAAVLRGEVLAAYRGSVMQADDQGAGLRIRLRLGEVPELASLPWECLYDAALGRFVALSDRTPLVRYLELPEPVRSVAAAPPLHVLAIVSAPDDYGALDAEKEWRGLEESLAATIAAGRVTLERLPRPTLAALQARLRRGDVHILHFIGHGGLDAVGKEGRLILTGEDGRGDPVGGDVLAALLRDHRPLRLVVLNACDGARSTSHSAFSGVAQQLVRAGTPAVIAMRLEITDAAAVAFAPAFYGALADAYPVDAALAEARKALFGGGNGIEWATPLLFMRSADGRLWALGEEVAAAEVGLPAARPPPWWDAIPERRGDVYNVQVGAGASGVAVGSNITQILHATLGASAPEDGAAIEARLAEVTAALVALGARLDGSLVESASFQLELLGGELTKPKGGDAPSANTITRVGDWLLERVPELHTALAGLFASPAVGRVVGRAGEAAVRWVKDRFGTAG